MAPKAGATKATAAEKPSKHGKDFYLIVRASRISTISIVGRTKLNKSVLSQTEEDVLFEQDIQRDQEPQLKTWLQYINHKKKHGKFVEQVFVRFKLWH